MDLQFTAAEEAFRHELRAWLDTVIPHLPAEPHRDDWMGRRSYDTMWQRMLFDAGYAGINWPKEFGGRGATPTEHLIFLEETERARAPYVGQNFVGLLHAGPTLIAEATPEQKTFHLPAILRGEHVWCQGFSEPGAGSDLASLSCRAHRDGDDYVINGQKIWTSFGHTADYCEMLVRTDTEAPKHRGITWLIVPMGLPGMDVRPLRTMEGSTEFCEVFFDEVRVPVANRVGNENDGWRVAMVTLSRAPPAPRRSGDAPARPGVAEHRRHRRAAHARPRARPHPRAVARHRRRYVPGATKHRRRAHPRPAQGSVTAPWTSN